MMLSVKTSRSSRGIESSDLLDLIPAIARGDAEPDVLDALAAAASERAKTIRLRREQEFLKSRIAEEDERLAHA